MNSKQICKTGWHKIRDYMMQNAHAWVFSIDGYFVGSVFAQKRSQLQVLRSILVHSSLVCTLRSSAKVSTPFQVPTPFQSSRCSCQLQLVDFDYDVSITTKRKQIQLSFFKHWMKTKQVVRGKQSHNDGAIDKWSQNLLDVEQNSRRLIFYENNAWCLKICKSHWFLHKPTSLLVLSFILFEWFSTIKKFTEILKELFSSSILITRKLVARDDPGIFWVGILSFSKE